MLLSDSFSFLGFFCCIISSSNDIAIDYAIGDADSGDDHDDNNNGSDNC